MEIKISSLKDFYGDFSKRIEHNYDVIMRQPEEQRFDVTQLINSMFGILIMPFETIKSFNKGSNLSVFNMRKIERNMKKASEAAYQDIVELMNMLMINHWYYDTYSDDWKEGVKVFSFVRRMRNSLAHGGGSGLHFFPINEGGEITTVLFADNDSSNAEKSSADKGIKTVDNSRELPKAFYAELKIEHLKRLMDDLKTIFSEYEERDFILPDVYRSAIDNAQKLMRKTGYVCLEFPDRRDNRRLLERDYNYDLHISQNEEMCKATFFCNDIDALNTRLSDDDMNGFTLKKLFHHEAC